MCEKTNQITSELKKNKDGLTIQDISNNTKISRNTVVKILAKLEGQNKLEIRQVGMEKLFATQMLIQY